MRISRRSRPAFTIVELLVATAITALIVVLLGTMFASLAGTTSRANQRIDAFRDARAALQLIQRDLSNIVRTQWEPDPITNPPPATHPTTRATAYLVLKDIYADPAPGNQQIYALASMKNAGAGDVCSVGYYCRWDDAIHAYTLRRFFRDSSVTFTAIANAAGYASDAILYTPDPAATATPALQDEALASYVWDLKIVAYDATGTILPTYPYICDPSATTPNPMPAALEISFKAISPAAAQAVTSISSSATDWMDPTTSNYQRLIAPHAQEFRTRVQL